jgi:hypothetical protein
LEIGNSIVKPAVIPFWLGRLLGMARGRSEESYNPRKYNPREKDRELPR